MTSSRPYLIRALHEWICDNDHTPYVVVDVLVTGVEVPEAYVTDGQIVLNISPNAVKGLVISNDSVYFNARFGGMPMDIYVPTAAVMAIYAKETGQGMSFGTEPDVPPPTRSAKSEQQKSQQPSSKGKPSLKIVK